MAKTTSIRAISMPDDMLSVVKQLAHLEQQSVCAWVRDTIAMRVGADMARFDRNLLNAYGDIVNLHAEEAARIASLEARQ
jgi:hypothetical protein